MESISPMELVPVADYHRSSTLEDRPQGFIPVQLFIASARSLEYNVFVDITALTIQDVIKSSESFCLHIVQYASLLQNSFPSPVSLDTYQRQARPT